MRILLLMTLILGLQLKIHAQTDPALTQLLNSGAKAEDKFHESMRIYTRLIKQIQSEPDDNKAMKIAEDYTNANRSQLEKLGSQFKSRYTEMSYSQKKNFLFSTFNTDYKTDLIRTTKALNRRAKKNPEFKKKMNELKGYLAFFA